MARTPIPTWFFVLVVVRQDDRFLLVHERKHGQQWYFPAGRVEPGESLAAAACRETWEEAGMRVQLDGVLRVEHQLIPGGARVRVLYTARPVDDAPPKQQPDEESLGAAWVRLEDLAKLPLRSDEVMRVLTEVSQGAPIHPLSVIAPEGSSLLAR
jgi:8-oxo-dGTP pyrophosphatase MutT (NUDIX family)